MIYESVPGSQVTILSGVTETDAALMADLQPFVNESYRLAADDDA